MNKEELFKELSEIPMQFEPGCQNLMDCLWSQYTDYNQWETEQMKENFRQLDGILGKLSLAECDEVWNLYCRLYWEHGRAGFAAGMRTAVRLMAEIRGESRQNLGRDAACP